MDWMRERREIGDEGGQALVESAIVIPMYVFLILGLLQLGMIHQARMMTKFAAYKAVRAGALHNADVDEMRKTALWALLPLVSRQSSGVELIEPVPTPMDYQVKWMKYGGLGLDWIVPGAMRNVEVAICGPTQDQITWKTDELDFDDPKAASAGTGGDDWKDSQRTKLRAQVTFNYRLPIPFANWVFHNVALGKEITRALYMGGDSAMDRAEGMIRRQKAWSDGLRNYDLLGETGIYVWPIRASYSMRMQSNLYKSNLPSGDSTSDRNGDCAARWL